MVESFYLSNVVPQNLENNAGFWNRFEMYCRDLTKKYSSVYIISGPLVLPQSDESGKKFVKYPVGFLCSYCLALSGVNVSSALRKLAHAIYRDFFSVVKNERFIRKILIFFLFLLKT